MQRRRLDTFTIRQHALLRDAAACIDANRTGIAIVIDDEQRVVDTITDGDIRRAILAGHSLELPLARLAERRQVGVYREPVTARATESDARLLAQLQARGVRQLPLLDEEGRVVDLIVLDDLVVGGEPLQMSAVVMAGGFGRRLGTLTQDTPKPMLPVGDRPLLEHIVDQLRDAGIRRLSVTTHYLGEVIRDHFADGARFGLSISYTDEREPLGTAGALSLLDTVDEPVLVMNGDILTRIDVRELFRFHREQGADLTVAVRQYDMTVPFGVVEADGARVTAIREKPKQTFLVNAGVYLLEPSVVNGLARGAKTDMPDVIQSLLGAGRRVVSFPIVEYWLDVGRPDDYARAQVDVEKLRPTPQVD